MMSGERVEVLSVCVLEPVLVAAHVCMHTQYCNYGMLDSANKRIHKQYPCMSFLLIGYSVSFTDFSSYESFTRVIVNPL